MVNYRGVTLTLTLYSKPTLFISLVSSSDTLLLEPGVGLLLSFGDLGHRQFRSLPLTTKGACYEFTTQPLLKFFRNKSTHTHFNFLGSFLQLRGFVSL